MSDKGFDKQVGGTHYQRLKIQPMFYSEMNNLNACAHSIIKYTTRAGTKESEDFYKEMEKIRHCTHLWEEAWEAQTGYSREDYENGKRHQNLTENLENARGKSFEGFVQEASKAVKGSTPQETAEALRQASENVSLTDEEVDSLLDVSRYSQMGTQLADAIDAEIADSFLTSEQEESVFGSYGQTPPEDCCGMNEGTD